MIIVEGPDGAGKTTLIRQLQERYELEVAPRVVSKDTEAMTDLQVWVEDNVQRGFQDLIFDRHRLISEPIYGPILRNKQSPGFTDFPWVSHMLWRFYKSNPVIIYCLPPLETVKANIANDPDNVVVADKIEAIYAAYAARASIDWGAAHSTNLVVWDYTRDFMLEEDPIQYFDSIMKHHNIQKRKP